MADTLKTMPISSLTDVAPEKDDKVILYRDSDKDAHMATVGELGDTMNENLSDAFSASVSYAVGDYCIYDNTLYKCTTAHSGAWSASDFEAVTVGDELNELNTNQLTFDDIFGLGTLISNLDVLSLAPGVYYSSGTSNTVTLTNAPGTVGFKLYVFYLQSLNNKCFLAFINSDNSGNCIRYRNSTMGTWMNITASVVTSV